MANPFDGSRWPRLVVAAAFSAQPAGVCVRGTGVRNTSKRGGRSMVDISADVRSVTYRRGRSDDFDRAEIGTATIVLRNTSGRYDPSNLSGPYVSAGVSLVDVGAAVTISAEYPVGMFTQLFTGRVTNVVLDAGLASTVVLSCADGLEDLGRARLAAEAATFDGDTTGQRINNLADRAGWSTLARDIDAGNDVLGPTILGAAALDLMREVETTEFGVLYVDATGRLTFRNRWATASDNRSVVVQLALTDTGGVGEAGMMELSLELSRDGLVNHATATRAPNAADATDTPAEQTATDDASQDAYGVLSLPVQVGQLKRSDAEVRSLLEGIVARHAAVGVRIREVRANALRGGAWASLLGLDLLDRISVRRDYGPNTITAELLIQGLAADIAVSPPRWSMTLSTSSPPPATEHFCVRGAGVRDTDVRGW